jgi:hypothetical protein
VPSDKQKALRVSFERDTLNSHASSNPLIKFENGNTFHVQLDGNLVYYDPKKPIWGAGSNVGKGDGNKLLFRFQDDGNLVLYYEGRAQWASDTHGTGRKFVIQDSWPYLSISNEKGEVVWHPKIEKK